MGEGAAVRAGQHFAPIIDLLRSELESDGHDPETIITSGSGLTVPGRYRPGKRWDLVIRHDQAPRAVIETKALGGPSAGNNFNNRVEEAIGNAIDLRAANSSPIWLGYFLLIEDHTETRKNRPHQRTEWAGNYQERLALCGQRLIEDGLYDAVFLGVSSATSPGPIQPSDPLSWIRFRQKIQTLAVRGS